MRARYVLLASFCLTFLIATPSQSDLPLAQFYPDQEDARFQSFVDDTAHFLVNGKRVAFVIPEAATRLQTILKTFSDGDLVVLEKDPDDPDILNNISAKSYSASRWRRVGVLTASLAGYWFVLWGLGQGLNKRNILLGEDGRYSNSKLQLALWFGVLIVSYLDTMMLRWGYCENNVIAGIGIPDNLLLLSGFSAVTFAGAKAITTAKDDAAKEKGLSGKSKAAGEPEGRSFLKNVLTNDMGHTDLGDVQMLIVTSLAVSVYLALVYQSLGSITCLKSVMLPEVDTTLMAILGLGQGAYLAKKAGGRVGES